VSKKQQLWNSDIREIRRETIHYSHSLDELDRLIELVEKPLYQRDDPVYTTNMLETLIEINNRMNKDAVEPHIIEDNRTKNLVI
jgi:hypothetical protein